MLSRWPLSKTATIIIAILFWWFSSFMYQLYKLDNPDEDPRVKQQTADALAHSDATLSTDSLEARNNSAYAGDRNAYVIARALQAKADTVENHLEMYYRQHHELPNNYRMLPCQENVDCPAGRDNGWFYVTHEAQWLAIRPVPDGKGLRFDCRISINPKMSRTAYQVTFCGNFSDEPLPALGY